MPARYSFLFDGQLGYLDHALANDAAARPGHRRRRSGTSTPTRSPLFDYNDTVPTTPGEATFERESAAAELDEADFRRASDHDPVVVGLDLSSLDVDDAVIVTRPRGGGSLALSAAVDGEYDSCPTVRLAVEGLDVVEHADDPHRRYVRRDHQQGARHVRPSMGRPRSSPVAADGIPPAGGQRRHVQSCASMTWPTSPISRAGASARSGSRPKTPLVTGA